jgi:hypothetical protein
MGRLRQMVLGAGAGALAGIVQPAVGKLEEELFFPDGEDTEIPKHFVRAAGARMGIEISEEEGLAAGTVFHVGYALFWGAAYALAREELDLPPLAAGLGLGGLLYLMAFSRMGAGTRVGSEPHPDHRPGRHWLLTTSMPMVYALTTAAAYEEIRRW